MAETPPEAPTPQSSILQDVKALLGIDAGNTAFDTELILEINSALSILYQLGVGPPGGVMITGEQATWDLVFTGGVDPALNNVKIFVAKTVKLSFDTPETGPGIAALERQIEQLTWRIREQREEDVWTLTNS